MFTKELILRLQRARQRGQPRASKGITSSKYPLVKKIREGTELFKKTGKAVVEIPSGKGTLSKFPWRDPGAKTTTRKTDFEGHSVGHKYSDIVKSLKTLGGFKASEILLDMLHGKETKEPLQGAEANALTKLMIIPHSSEVMRAPGSDKLFRAILRAMKAKKPGITLETAFTGKNPIYPLAKKTKNYMDLLDSVTSTEEDAQCLEEDASHSEEKDLGGYMSSSSDEE